MSNKRADTAMQDEILITPNPRELKSTVLRPLADKFQELTRQIDSGEYEVPKTLKDAEAITENYINQAYERLEKFLVVHDRTLIKQIRDGLPGSTKALNWPELLTESEKIAAALAYNEAIDQVNQTLNDIEKEL